MGASPIIVEDVSIWTAVFQGLLAFFSPCVLPLIPFFLSLLMERKCTSRICLFCVGFCASFALMGALSGFVGSRFETGYVGVVSGSLIITLSVLYILDIRTFRSPVKLLDRFGWDSRISGLILGSVVGLMWMPCSTPALAGALAMASLSGTALKGAVLLLAYSLGILVPFLVLGRPVSEIFYKMPDSLRKLVRVSIGVVMMAMGVGVLTGHPIILMR